MMEIMFELDLEEEGHESTIRLVMSMLEDQGFEILYKSTDLTFFLFEHQERSFLMSRYFCFIEILIDRVKFVFVFYFSEECFFLRKKILTHVQGIFSKLTMNNSRELKC